MQLDGSFHKWYQKRGPQVCLMNMVDDATSTVEAYLDDEETIWTAVHVLRQWIQKYGVPLALYTDWKNVYAREPTEKELLHGQVPVTQFGRMCQKLDVRIITANSPEAKGRVERSHGTHQDRLIKKMGRLNIRTHQEANRYLQQEYLAEHNERFESRPSRRIITARRPAHGSWSRRFVWRPSAAFPMIGWCAMRIAISNWSEAAIIRPGKPR